MKKIFSLFLLTALIVSCGKVETPKNNALNKGHEEASKVVISFVPGTLANDTIHHNVYATGFTPLSDNSTIKSCSITHEENEDHQIVTTGKITLVAGQWYQMNIHFFNRAGAPIEQQFIRNEEQRNMHQFYFQYKQINDMGKATVVTNPQQIGFDYRYGDLFNGKILMPAVGFTGYIRVKPTQAHDFIINPILVHIVPPGVKTNKRGESYPFYLPPLQHLGVTDINFDFPISVVSQH